MEGTKILGETWDENELVPLYDNEDSVCGIVYNGMPFYFHKNLQGDVIAISDANANIVARYTYDAWGVPTIVQDDVLKAYDDYGNVSDYNIGAINPFRYRSYYYDTEIGMYYLQSRYYNPTVGRFINGDEAVFSCVFGTINTHNGFEYCMNNPTINKDSNGTVAIVDDVAVAGITVTALVVIAIFHYISTPQFQSAWNSFCVGLIDLLSRIWGWLKSLFMSATRIVENAVEKNKAKAKEIIKKHNWHDYYWIASSITFKRKNVSKKTYFPCAPISFNNAKSYVNLGGDVFASSKSSAKKLAYAAGNGRTPIGPEIHGGIGYFYHYHAYKHSGHIFYI